MSNPMSNKEPTPSAERSPASTITPDEDSRAPNSTSPTSWHKPGSISKPSKKGYSRWLSPIRHWYRLVRLDLLVMASCLIIVGILSNWAPKFRQSSTLWPVWRDPVERAWRGPLEISYPVLESVLDSTECGIVVMLIPPALVLLMQTLVKSFWDANAAILGLFKALSAMTVIQLILKQYIIRLRPNFLARCRPVPGILDAQFRSLDGDPGRLPLFVNISVCESSPDELLSSMQSFPSGHTGSAFAVGIFLALYLNAKLKAFADCGTPFWKMMVVMAPVMGAMVIAAGLVIDKHHHINDVLLSSLLGIACALLAYRSQYRSLFAYSDNHIPFVSSLSSQPLLPLSMVSHINVSERNVERGQFLAVRWPRHNRVGKLVNEGMGDRSHGLDGADGSHTVEMVGGLEDEQRGVIQHERAHVH